jgi:glucosyl-dolichyl phosphate glucuronosyltransferase
MTTDISVLIRTYTEARWNYLVEALRSLEKQTAPAAEIVVVVDHNPALLEKVKAEFPYVVTVDSREPKGSSGAWNAGVAAVKYDLIAFLDDDAVAAPDWLEQIAVAYNDDKIVGVGGTITPIWQGGMPKWYPAEFKWIVGCTYIGLPTTTGPIRNLIGANMSLRRYVFQEVGMFRTQMGHQGAKAFGNEETELCIRIHQKLPKTVFIHEPKVAVQHNVPASRSTFKYFCSRCYWEGQSKARTTQIAGTNDGLSSERKYTFQTLPLGVLRGLADPILRRDIWGGARAAAIVVGLSVTVLGFLVGKINLMRESRRSASAPSMS